MATDLSDPITDSAVEIPGLEPGDHLDQATFHERYEAMPPGTRAELIGGIVYMSSPAKMPHGRGVKTTVCWLGYYEAATPGVEALDNATAILGDDSESQPDAALRILETHGGQSHENEDGYLVGAPELIVEVASSSASYDLHTKLRDYEQYGVKEYVVAVTRQKTVRWFTRRGDRFEEQSADKDGLFRSREFGGLWLDPNALFEQDLTRLKQVVELGLKSPEHEATVQRLTRAPS